MTALVHSILLATTLSIGNARDQGSLERLLEHARRERAAVHVELRARVDSLKAQLETVLAPSASALDSVRSDLDRLGPEAGSLLVPLIEPGTPADSEAATAAERRAEEMTRAIARLRAPGIVEDLVRATELGSETGRRNAVRALAAVPERDRAAEHLTDLYGRTSGKLRLACVVALASLGGPRSEPVLRTALTDDDPEIVRTVLSALAAAGNREAAPAVLNLTRVARASAPVVGAIVGYWSANADLVDGEIVDALLALTLRTDVDAQDRVAILKAMPRFEETRSRGFRRRLDPVLLSPDALVRQAALVCASLTGDRTARRELIREFDDVVDNNERWWKGYADRGSILLEIEDYADAAKDLRDALELLGVRAREVTHQDLWIDLARCYVLTGKLARAKDALEEMGMTPRVRTRLLADPDFEPLVEHSTYGKLFD